MPLDPEIAAEIAEARRILREDRIIAGHKELRDRFDKHFPPETPEPPAGGDPPEGTPPAPPAADPPADPPKSRSKWWGDALD